MNNVPFFTSTALAFIGVVLSLVSFFGGQKNNHLQDELLKKQSSIQDLQIAVNLKNQDFNQQQEKINAGAQVAQKYGPPILSNMGYLAAKNKNEKLKLLLVRQKLESFIPTDEKLKEIDKQIEEARVKGQPAPAPAPIN
jgi:hypothetical protein